MADRSQEAVATSKATASAASVGTSAASAAASRDSRVALLIVNNSSDLVYFGGSSSLTTSNGIPIPAAGSYREEFYTGAVYLIGAVGSQDVRLWEVG